MEVKVVSPIRIARMRLGWSQAKLGQACGCTNTCIANLEKGTRLPSFRLCIALVRALDLPMHQLINECLAFWESKQGAEKEGEE